MNTPRRMPKGAVTMTRSPPVRDQHHYLPNMLTVQRTLCQVTTFCRDPNASVSSPCLSTITHAARLAWSLLSFTSQRSDSRNVARGAQLLFVTGKKWMKKLKITMQGWVYFLCVSLVAVAGQGKEVSSGDFANTGAWFYATYCSACHGMEGRGNGPVAPETCRCGESLSARR